MEISLDELEFDNDKIKSFLNNKLKEIKSRNEHLQRTLAEREEYSKTLVRAALRQRSQCTVNAAVEWKKIFNGKYSIGYKLTNTTNKNFDVCKLFLKWDSKQPLHYAVNLFQEEATISCEEMNCRKVTSALSKTKDLQSNGYLVVTFNLPTFLDKRTYDVSGNLQLRCQGEEVITDLPVVQVSTKDVTDRVVNNCPVIEGGFEDLLTLVSSTDVTDLILILSPEWKSTLESTFEIHCYFTAMNITNICKKYFYSKRISPMLDDILLEVHCKSKIENEVHLRVYARNSQSLLYLIHHLYTSIQDVVIIPKALHKNFLMKQNSAIHTTKQGDEDAFRKCVQKEIVHVEEYFKSDYTGSYSRFRNDLALLEQDTDFKYLKLHQQDK